jgi:diacylglycerol kinase family enzyme
MTSPFGTLAVIADPAAGEGRVGDRLPAIRRALDASDLDYYLRVAETRGDGERLTASALEDGFRYVVAVGDDASVQAVSRSPSPRVSATRR